MARRPCRSLVATVTALLGFSLALEAGTARTIWQSGKIISVDLYGQGEIQVKATGKKQSVHKRKDFWWSYCIATGKRSYSAVLRKSPSKSGLRVNESVRFSASRDRLYVISPEGKCYEMRVLREGAGDCCRD